MVGVFDFKAQNLEKQNVSNHLQATARTAGATADKHQQEENASAETVPLVEIVSGISCGGDDRNNLEQAVAEAVDGLGGKLVCFRLSEIVVRRSK